MSKQKQGQAIEAMDAIGYAVGRVLAIVIADPNAGGPAITERLDALITELRLDGEAGDGRALFAGHVAASMLDGLVRGRFS